MALRRHGTVSLSRLWPLSSVVDSMTTDDDGLAVCDGADQGVSLAGAEVRIPSMWLCPKPRGASGIRVPNGVGADGAVVVRALIERAAAQSLDRSLAWRRELRCRGPRHTTLEKLAVPVAPPPQSRVENAFNRSTGESPTPRSVLEPARNPRYQTLPLSNNCRVIRDALDQALHKLAVPWACDRRLDSWLPVMK
jgi:hypothetical protein